MAHSSLGSRENGYLITEQPQNQEQNWN